MIASHLIRMRRSVRGIGVALALAGIAAAADAADPADPLLAPVGAETFRQYCASCHGATGVGDGPVAAELKKPPADLTRIAARRSGVFPEAEITRWIDGRFDAPAHGTREMPVWGRVFQETVRPGADPDEAGRGKLLALVEYLKSIQAK
jgi:mono/diheme cytochrome c family protein